MKQIFVICGLMVMISFTINAQNVFSKQNLEQASQEDLNLYLEKARNLKKTGAKLSIRGSITAVAGLAMFTASWAGTFGGSFTAGAGLIMFLGGTGVTLVGLPILITGSSRVKRINGIKNTVSDGILLEMSPYSFHDNLTQNNQSGITLRLRF